MPTWKNTTVCEMTIEAKKRGLKGYSKLKKAELMVLLYGNKTASAPALTPKPRKSRRTQLELLQADAQTFFNR